MSRRIARVLFTPELLIHLTRGRFEIVNGGVPSDARIRGHAFDVERNAVTLFLEHDSFADVPEGEVVPILEPPTVRILP